MLACFMLNAAACACVMSPCSSVMASPPNLGPVIPCAQPDLADVVASLDLARLRLVGIRVHALTEEFVPGQSDPYRTFEEELLVAEGSSRLTRRNTMSVAASGGVEALSGSEVFARSASEAVHWVSDSRHAILVADAAALPRCSSDYSFLTCWFPIPYNAPGTAPVDLREMLLDPTMSLAPFTQAVDAEDCLVLQSDSQAPGIRVTVWIDPERGMFPRLQRVEDQSGVVAEWHITGFLDLGDGAWLPSAGEYWSRGNASAVPPFDAPFFRLMHLVDEPSGGAGGGYVVPPDDLLQVPAGSTVEDAATGEVWFAGRPSYAETGAWALAVLRGEAESGDSRGWTRLATGWRLTVVASLATMVLGGLLGFGVERARGDRLAR